MHRPTSRKYNAHQLLSALRHKRVLNQEEVTTLIEKSYVCNQRCLLLIYTHYNYWCFWYHSISITTSTYTSSFKYICISVNVITEPDNSFYNDTTDANTYKNVIFNLISFSHVSIIFLEFTSNYCDISWRYLLHNSIGASIICNN